MLLPLRLNLDSSGNTIINPAAATARALAVNPTTVLGSITITPAVRSARAVTVGPASILITNPGFAYNPDIEFEFAINRTLYFEWELTGDN